MKFSKKALPDGLEGEVLIHHSVHGWMVAKWNDKYGVPSYDFLGFRPGEHEGLATPLVVMVAQPKDVERVEKWAVIE